MSREGRREDVGVIPWPDAIDKRGEDIVDIVNVIEYVYEGVMNVINQIFEGLKKREVKKPERKEEAI